MNIIQRVILAALGLYLGLTFLSPIWSYYVVHPTAEVPSTFATYTASVFSSSKEKEGNSDRYSRARSRIDLPATFLKGLAILCIGASLYFLAGIEKLGGVMSGLFRKRVSAPLILLAFFFVATIAEAKDTKRTQKRDRKPKADHIDYLKLREDFFKKEQYDSDGLFEERYHITNWRAIGKCPTPTIYDSPLCTGTPYEFV